MFRESRFLMGVLLFFCCTSAVYAQDSEGVAASAGMPCESSLAHSSGKITVSAGVPRAPFLQSALHTLHQGEHYITRCRAERTEDGTLCFWFPIDPAYYLSIGIGVKDTQFTTKLWWQPVYPIEVENVIDSVTVQLEKETYTAGDVLNGYLDLSFTTTEVRHRGSLQRVSNGTQHSYSVTGPFSALVRPEGFDTYADENIKTYTQDIALYEMDWPKHAHSLYFAADGSFTEKRFEEEPFENLGLYDYDDQLQAMREQFFLTHCQSAGTMLRELTWDINPYVPFSDGDERLTIWFAQYGKEWKHAGHKKWMKHSPWSKAQ